METNHAKKVCVITCYKYPDYVRARVLRNAIASMPDTELIVVKNRHTNLLRYPEVFLKLIKTRMLRRPTGYILTFRGYEFLPFVRLLTLGRPLVFDELVNLVEWTVYEHRKLKENSVASKVLKSFYSRLLKSIDIILADTDVHAQYAAELMQIPISKYKVIPVGADEEIFKPASSPSTNSKDKFTVFYYGNMLPLHGLDIVVGSAIALRDKQVSFRIIGGNHKAQELIQNAVKKGADIRYSRWVPFEKLPAEIAASSICLGGPFGNTLQAKMVITGKTYQFLASTKPVIIGEITDLRHFQDKKNCLLVEQGNMGALTGAVLWAKNNSNKLPVIAERGHKLFIDNYSTVKISKLLAEIV